MKGFFRFLVLPFSFFYEKVVLPIDRRHTAHLLAVLSIPIYEGNFLKYADFSHEGTVGAIRNAVNKNVTTWEELGIASAALENLYDKRRDELVTAYQLSFFSDYWKTYDQTCTGYSVFRNFADAAQIQNSEFYSLKRNFAEKLYRLLRIEQPGLSEDEFCRILVNECHLPETEIRKLKSHMSDLQPRFVPLKEPSL